MEKIIQAFLEEVSQRNQNEPEFMQAVTEVAENVIPYIVQHDIYYGQNILMRMVEPERVVSFRVAWIDDQEEIRVNRGYRVQMNSAIGPYKGGLRFHPSVNLSVLKFLAFPCRRYWGRRTRNRLPLWAIQKIKFRIYRSTNR